MSNQQKFGSAGAVLFLAALVALAFISPLFGWFRPWAFVVAVVFMICEFAAIGYAIQGRLAGVIIDARNVMSLSKLQACAWTVLVLSALLIAAAYNFARSPSTALDIKIPSDLLVAMGISATSLAATPALLSLKTTQQTSTPDDASHTGAMATNGSVQEASWTDMLTGDEVGNATTPDLGKIQQLLVTLLLLGVYGTMVFEWYGQPKNDPIGTLPGLDQGFIWLMGISHAGYLAYKAAPHTNTNNNTSGANATTNNNAGAGANATNTD